MRFDFYTPSEITDILGKRLKQQRLYQNLTQAELSQKAGIGLSTISRIESGEGGTLDNVIRYAMSVGLVNEFANLFANNPKTIDEVIAQKTSRKRASSKS
ncbi:helix-turn-helix transcriptional regulator [Moraxella osloensis]|nr:helix-turn-helix transcriptional regulator [Moraxella osloensis]QRO13116.1 helix-turn-helix transcriptional regulator [Moraxella osloensis]